MKSAYTLEDLAEAKKRLEAAEARWEAYDGNNPNKHRAAVAQARQDLYRVETAVKQARLVPLSPHEELTLKLDELYPDAQNGTVIEFAGKRYTKKYRPGARTLSGNVKFWIASWSSVD